MLSLILAGAGLAQTGAGHRLISEAGLSVPSEPFTALSFTHPSREGLTGQYGPGLVPVSFTIVNYRHRSIVYRWQIEVGRLIRWMGAVKVPAAASAVVDRRVLVRCPLPPSTRRRHRIVRFRAPRMQIRVALPLESEAIDFWEQCVG